MIAHLSGTLLEKHLQRLVVDVGGVGYEVVVPLSTFYTVGDAGTRVMLRIHTHVREDALQLFGFATPIEQALFERLISVSGIGPKVALAVLSGIEPPELVRAIRSSDVARLTRIPGVGKKTAERLVVELKDRLPHVGEPEAAAAVAEDGDLRADLLSALANLGYQRAAVDLDLPEDKWVERIEIRPGAPEVVHHILLFVRPPRGADDERRRAGEDGISYWGIYVPGNSKRVYPQGLARRLPKGSRLQFQVHYTPNGTATEDVTQVGFVFADREPENEVSLLLSIRRSL